MDFGPYMIPVYGIGIAAALVVAIPEWRITGLIVFFASFLNIFFLTSIMQAVQIHNGAFFMFFDGTFALVLFFASGGEKTPLIMSMILAIFFIFHGLLEISVVLGTYSFFWREYANIILTLNLLQLSFLVWGLWSGVRNYWFIHISLGSDRRGRFHHARNKTDLAQ